MAVPTGRTYTTAGLPSPSAGINSLRVAAPERGEARAGGSRSPASPPATMPSGSAVCSSRPRATAFRAQPTVREHNASPSRRGAAPRTNSCRHATAQRPAALTIVSLGPAVPTKWAPRGTHRNARSSTRPRWRAALAKDDCPCWCRQRAQSLYPSTGAGGLELRHGLGRRGRTLCHHFAGAARVDGGGSSRCE